MSKNFDPLELFAYFVAIALGLAMVFGAVTCAQEPSDKQIQAIERCVMMTKQPAECGKALERRPLFGRETP